MDDLAKLIIQSGTEVQSNINKKIEGLQQVVDNLKMSIDKRFENVSMQCVAAVQKIEAIEDELLRRDKANELRIVGIPFIEGENLTDIFNKIASKLGYETGNPVMAPFLNRIGNIKVKPAVRAKSMFFGSYLKNLKLCLADIGLQYNGRIIISENFTKANKQIFDEAYSLKRQRKVSQVFTIVGVVHIRIKQNKPMSIGSVADLHKIGLTIGVSTESNLNHEDGKPVKCGGETPADNMNTTPEKIEQPIGVMNASEDNTKKSTDGACL